jgi:hypothetical protein
MYKLINLPNGGQSVLFVEKNAFIPFDPANSDFANFKKEVLAGAELQDADGNVMTQANEFIASLP